MLNCKGSESEDIFKLTRVIKEKKKGSLSVLKHFDYFFKVRHNVIIKSANFNQQYQQEGESCEQYIAKVYRLAEHCEFAALKEELIWDRLVVGIKGTALSEHLQMDPSLTLKM